MGTLIEYDSRSEAICLRSLVRAPLGFFAGNMQAWGALNSEGMGGLDEGWLQGQFELHFLPKIVKDRYATELRSRSLASIKDEISTALESLLEQVQANKDARALRSQIGSNNNGSRNRNNFNGFY